MNRRAPLVLLLSALLPLAVGAQDATPTSTSTPTAPATPSPVAAPAPTPPASVPADERNRTLAESLAQSGDHARMAQALDASGLSGGLSALSPLTVFAPTDSAFSSMVDVSLDDLLKPENRGRLAELLRYHVVAGIALDRATLNAKIDAGGGQAALTTVQGGLLTVRRSGDEFTVTDATNHTAHITRADVYQRNGVMQVVDQVLMPTAH